MYLKSDWLIPQVSTDSVQVGYVLVSGTMWYEPTVVITPPVAMVNDRNDAHANKLISPKGGGKV